MQAAADAALRRALERAGNRLKGRAGVLRDTLRGVPAVLAPAHAGPALRAAGGLSDAELLEGAWDDLVVRYRKLATVAMDDATGIIGQMIGEWRTGYPEAMANTFKGHLDESADILRKGMDGLASDLFIDPKGLDEVGELVPNGFVRHVLARAGGQAAISSTGYAFVSLTADEKALPGMVTGPLVTTALTDHGGSVEGFRWVYGFAHRSQSFHPHVALGGVIFQNYDDPKLANGRGWPPFAYYMPGDHAGCKCDAEPIMLTPAQAKALSFRENAGAGDLLGEPQLTPKEARARAREKAITDSAEKWGVSPDEVRAALPEVRSVRSAIAADAAATQYEQYGILSQGANSAAFLPRPPTFGSAARKAGEWDWLEGLSKLERDRLSRAWYLDGGTGSIDVVMEDLARAAGRTDLLGDTSSIVQEVWLPANRRIEAAGALRRGRIPIDKHYSGSADVDANFLAPNVHQSGIDVYKVVGVEDADAAGYLAQLERERVGEQAYSVLRAAAADPESAPWRMSFQSWESEVREIEYVMREVPDEVTPAMRSRYDALVPLHLDAPGLDYEALYSVIIETARVANMDVAEWAVIPWA